MFLIQRFKKDLVSLIPIMESKYFRVLTFTSLAHFANDGVFLIFPLLIVYYTTEEKISVVFLGGLAIVYTLLSGSSHR